MLKKVEKGQGCGRLAWSAVCEATTSGLGTWSCGAGFAVVKGLTEGCGAKGLRCCLAAALGSARAFHEQWRTSRRARASPLQDILLHWTRAAGITQSEGSGAPRPSLRTSTGVTVEVWKNVMSVMKMKSNRRHLGGADLAMHAVPPDMHATPLAFRESSPP